MVYCDPLLEMSQSDDSNDGSQTMLFFNGEIRVITPNLSQLPLIIWSTVFSLFLSRTYVVAA